MKRFLWWCRRMRELIIKNFSDFNLPLFVIFWEYIFSSFVNIFCSSLGPEISKSKKSKQALMMANIHNPERNCAETKEIPSSKSFRLPLILKLSSSSLLNFKQEISRSSDEWRRAQEKKEFSCLFSSWKMCWWRQMRRLSGTSKELIKRISRGDKGI